MRTEDQLPSSIPSATRSGSIFDWLNKVLRPYVEMGPFDAAIFLTLIAFCIDFSTEPQLVMVCSFAIIVRPLARSPIYWLFITCVLIGLHWHLWYLAQNHWFLMGYWSLAIALSLFSPSQEQALANSAR
jgi:hypothetical protein